MLQIMCKDTKIQISIARYSFIQLTELSELRQCGMNKLALHLKRQVMIYTRVLLTETLMLLVLPSDQCVPW